MSAQTEPSDEAALSRAHGAPESGEVHIWHSEVNSQETAEEYWTSLLSEDELRRANRFKFQADRRRFVFARGRLRALLSEYLKVGPRELRFIYSESGKPDLADEFRHARLSFNVSHSGDLVTFAITNERKIGVDIEMIRYDLDVGGIAKRFFSQREQDALAALPASEAYTGFFQCWTRKEAYVKAVGTGLSRPLRSFDVSLGPGEPARLLATRPDETIAARWSMAELGIHKGFAGAVAVEGPSPNLIVRQLSPILSGKPL